MRSVAPSSDVTRIALLVLLIGVLLAGSLWTMLPFLGGLIWATTIVVATWPLLLWMQRITGGRRSFAVAIMTILVLLAFIVPFAFAISTLLDAAGRSPALMRDFLTRGLGPPPASDSPTDGGRSQQADRTRS
jgi:predicted PurR-regulated permease PerM